MPESRIAPDLELGADSDGERRKTKLVKSWKKMAWTGMGVGGDKDDSGSFSLKLSIHLFFKAVWCWLIRRNWPAFDTVYG